MTEQDVVRCARCEQIGRMHVHFKAHKTGCSICAPSCWKSLAKFGYLPTAFAVEASLLGLLELHLSSSILDAIDDLYKQWGGTPR